MDNTDWEAMWRANSKNDHIEFGDAFYLKLQRMLDPREDYDALFDDSYDSARSETSSHPSDDEEAKLPDPQITINDMAKAQRQIDEDAKKMEVDAQDYAQLQEKRAPVYAHKVGAAGERHAH